MKTILQRIGILLVLLFVSLKTFGFSVTYPFGDIYYAEDYSTCRIVSVSINKSVKEISIPEEVSYNNKTYTVTDIDRKAFKYCKLTTINIPKTVKYIRESAFEGCYYLTQINLPDDSNLKEINEYAFQYCESLTNFYIPDGVKTIDMGTFNGCESLESVRLSKNLQSIGFEAFCGCSNLKSVTIPGKVSNIYWIYKPDDDNLVSIFQECRNLRELIFPWGYNWLSVRGLFLSNHFGREIPLQIEHLSVDRELSWDEYTRECLNHIVKLTLGPNVKEFKAKLEDNEEIETIISHSLNPPKVKEFSNVAYMNTIVMVPEEALDAYKAHPVWGKFWNLQVSGVDDVKIESKKEVIGRYDMNGRSVSEDYKGLVIVRFSDGSCKKMLNR
ncbi:MAG: leucine-rich repeat domain-containing protein [Muribaculaceae bacterium]|nr:leucine-rich repeat domain-containing protein [Muribaculaceae bacterium]